ncbi:Hypothetical_protein [Hexamita inflata]|uniref:Hypothetical_protein n=1 Tax=Hexamita inflata TaxID=28002 RepID=A0AA86UU38_9EUKA|nr:Hypothetical protein HINF_LOCUS55649 [Hexamita inflata]
MKKKYICRSITMGCSLLIFSPLLLTLYLLWGITIFPIQLIIKLCIANKHGKESAAKQVPNSSVQSQNLTFSQIQLENMMFTCKLGNQDLYMAISSSSLCLVTKSRICIDQRPIYFNILPKQVINYYIDVNFHKLLSHTTQFKWVQSFPGYLNHAVLFNNRYYFTYFDFLYMFDNQQVVQLCQIPRFHHSFRKSWAHVYPSSQLFTFNSKLYVHNSSKQLYVLKSNKNYYKLKLFRSNQKNRTYYQFNRNIFCVHQNAVCILRNNFKLQVLLSGQQMIVLFCGGGVLLVQCQNALSSVLVVNMLDKEVEPIVDQNIVYYLQNDIQQLLCFGQTGVELKKTILNALLGPEFQQRVYQQYQNWNIKMKVEEWIYNQKAIYRYQKIVLENKMEKVHGRLQKEQEKIQQRIVELIKIQQHIVAGFTQFSETGQ